MSEETVQRRFDEQPVRYLTLGRVLENRAEELGKDSFLYVGGTGEEISFASLNQRSNAIGNGLSELGIEQGSVVSTVLEDKPATLSVMFGCAKIGAVYAPINNEFRGESLRYQLNDSNPELLIVEDQFINRLNRIAAELETSPEIIVLKNGENPAQLTDEFSMTTFEDLHSSDSQAPDFEASWNHDAWIMYTSGTTGLPKGVTMSHRYVLLNHSGVKAHQFNTEDVLHNWMPLYHIGGASGQIVSALQAGASVALWNRFSRSQFWDRIDKYGATSVTLLTVMLEWLLGAPESDTDAQNTINKLQVGELPNNYEEIADRFGIDFINVSYSQTEIGAATWGVISPADSETTPSNLYRGRPREEIVERMEAFGIPVVERAPGQDWMGQPRDDLYQVTTLNKLDETIPDGESGEIAVRPNLPGVMMYQYINKPAKVVEDTRNLWMHTDDIGVRKEEGDFFYIDRKGNIIRRRGENISSEQYDTIVNNHPKVDTAAVFPVASTVDKEDAIAVVVKPLDGVSITNSELSEYLDSEVADFMKPQYIEFVEEIPFTQTNKVQKNELRKRLFE